MLEHLCYTASSKASERLVIAKNIALVVEDISLSNGHDTNLRFCKFLSKLSHSRDPSSRQFAVEIACDIFYTKSVDAVFSEGLHDLIINRCDDKIPTVRVAASKCLGKLTLSPTSESIIHASLDALAINLSDVKPAVRKAAIKSFQELFSNEKIRTLRGAKIQIDIMKIAERSRDVALSIRNQVLDLLDSLVEIEIDSVNSSWTSAVLPLVYDPEQSVQTKACACINRVLFKNICAKDQRNVWSLVAQFGEEEIKCLKKCLYHLVLDNEIKVKPLITALQGAIDARNDSQMVRGGWVILNMICGGIVCSNQDMKKAQESFRKSVDTKCLLNQWDSMFDTEVENSDLMIHCMGVLEGLASRVPADEATRIASLVFEHVQGLNLEPDLCRKCLHVLVALCESKATNEAEGRKLITSWATPLVEACTVVLRQLHQSGTVPAKLISSLFIIGELSILGLDPDDKLRLFVTLPDEVVTLTMGALTMSGLDMCIRPHVLVATGKLCLSSEQIAKDATHMLVRELDECKGSDIIRSNVIVILGDLCRRYTNMIDPHMDVICACLSDPSVLVRRHALVLLTGLLQEDYIKWRGSLFVRYLMCAADPNEEIRDLVRYSLKEIFAEKNPGLFHGSFVDVLFAINRCLSHPKYQLGQVFQVTDKELDADSLSHQRKVFVFRITGPEGTNLRMELYNLLLDQLQDTQRLEVTNKLCLDVLGAIIDGVFSMPPASSLDQVMQDCFRILCCPNIKVKNATTAKPLEEEDVPTATQVALATAKGRVLSKLERKNLVENVVPMLVSLYRLLQRNKSSYMKHVMQYLCVLMKDFKAEVEQVLDHTMTEEILFDLAQEQRLVHEEEERGFSSTRKRKSRRISIVTFEPSATDRNRRASTGILKTPIPSAKKRRKSSLTAPRLSENLNSSNTDDVDSTSKSRKSLSAMKRNWTVEANDYKSDSPLTKNLSVQLMGL